MWILQHYSRVMSWLLGLVLGSFSLVASAVYVTDDGQTWESEGTMLNWMCTRYGYAGWGSRYGVSPPTLEGCTGAAKYQVLSYPGSQSCGTYHTCSSYNPPPPPCPAAGTSAVPSGQIGYGESPEGSNPVLGVICGADQCAIQIEAATAIPIGGGMQANYITQATYTGQRITGSCPLIVTAPSPTDPTLPNPIDDVTPAADTPDGVPLSQSDCPAGSAFGQVNGVNVCAPAGSKIAYVPDTTTQTGTGGDYSSSSSDTDTVNSDGTVTRSNTTTTSGPGGASTTTSSNTTGGKVGDKGSTPNVTLGPAPPAEGGDAPTVPGLAPGTGFDGAGKATPEFSVGSHFSASNVCIADRSVTALGLTITIPLSQLCPYFEAMYNLVSLFAVFAALRILVMA